MEAAANARIQSILAGSSARGGDMRKRKLTDIYYDEQPARRHNSVSSEGEHFYNPPQIACGPQQVNSSFRAGLQIGWICSADGMHMNVLLSSQYFMLFAEGRSAGVH